MILEVLERSDILFWVWKNESILFQTLSLYMEATAMVTTLYEVELVF